MVEASPPGPIGSSAPPPHEQRRLQAIMFTDMFGYSRMMGEDEVRTIRLVEEHRQIVRDILPLHGGREHQTIGDAFVVLFDSALNAVSCAVAIQQRLRARNAGLPDSEQIWIRVGIHLDDIVLRDGHIYGDGVNLAARVEPLAEKGGICVTEPVLRHVEGKVAFGFVPLGEQALKNIARPPALYAVHVEGAPRPRRGRAGPPSKTPLLVAGLVVVVVVVAALALRWGRPLAVSEDPVAAARLAEGLKRQVDLDIAGMNDAFLAAIARDDGLAAAHLRLAAWSFEDTPLVAREHFIAATRHRDRLDEHDRALLDALSPYVGATVDLEAFVDKTDAGLARFERSPEHRLWAAKALALAGRHAEAVATAEAGDVAGFQPLAWLAGVSSLALPDGEARGVGHLRRCVERAPTSTRCLLALGIWQLHTGRCEEMERSAREWGARAPRDGNADDMLAWALAARAAPVQSVVEAMKRSQQKRPEALRPVAVAMDKTRLAAWLGAFDEAEQSARQWLAELGTHPDVALQVMPSTYVVAVLLEQGRLAEAEQAASAFLRRAPAFEPDAFGDDWTILFDNVRAAAGALADDEIEARRAAWMAEQRRRRPDPHLLVHRWRDAWGEWARNPTQATHAKAAWSRLLDDGLVVPPTETQQPGLALAIGLMHLHTGDATAARPFLEHAAASCAGLLEPLRMTRAWLALGQARAAVGDVAGARAAFQVVLDRWGDASHSVTADAARAGLAALSP